MIFHTNRHGVGRAKWTLCVTVQATYHSLMLNMKPFAGPIDC